MLAGAPWSTHRGVHAVGLKAIWWGRAGRAPQPPVASGRAHHAANCRVDRSDRILAPDSERDQGHAEHVCVDRGHRSLLRPLARGAPAGARSFPIHAAQVGAVIQTPTCASPWRPSPVPGSRERIAVVPRVVPARKRRGSACGSRVLTVAWPAARAVRLRCDAIPAGVAIGIHHGFRSGCGGRRASAPTPRPLPDRPPGVVPRAR